MNVLEYIIRAKDATASGVRSALDRVKSFAASVGRNLMNIKAGIEMLGSAARTFWTVFKKAFAFETMTVQFKTLIGSMDEAREHMKMLQDLGATPPFSLEQFAAASRTLMVMTENVLGFKGSLELIGDAAAATGQNIDSLAHHIGLAFASIRDGAPITRATFALRSMGVITPAVAEKLDELQKAGASTVELWELLEGHLKRFEGAMKETESTGNGLIGAIQSQWDISVRTFGEAFMEAAKDGLGSMLETMKELNEDGSIALWAEETLEWLDNVAEGFAYVGRVAGTVFKGIWNGIKGTLGTAWAFAAGADQKFAEQKGWEKLNILAQVRAGANVAGTFWDEQFGTAAEENARKEAEYRAARREQLKRRQEERRKSQYKGKDGGATGGSAKDEGLSIQEALAEAQRKLDEKNAKAKAEAEAEEERKAAEKYAEEMEKYERELADWEERESERLLMEEERERLKIEQKIAAARHRYLQQELSEREKEERDAQTALAEAQQKVRQAWGWYRDKDSLKAQLEEEKAEAEAQKQYVKDFENLKRWRSDWRTADNLSLDEEAVRRVALAKEEEASAQQAVLETAENTRRAADALEELLAAEEEGE